MPLLPFSGPVIPTPVPISKGGTGSATQNFVDLTQPQTVEGEKTFNSKLVVSYAPASTGITLQAGATSTTLGAFVVQQSTTRSQNFFGLYDSGTSQYYGIAPTSASVTVGGVAAVTLGGYYSGLAVKGTTNNSAKPILAALNSTDAGGTTIGSQQFLVRDDHYVATYYNLLDDGTGNIIPGTNNVHNLGSPSLYWLNLYATRTYLNSTAYLDGGTAGQITITAATNKPFTVNTSNTGDFTQVFNGQAGSISTNNHVQFAVGVNGFTNNRAEFNFQYVGNNSYSNNFFFGLSANAAIMGFDGYGQVTLANSTAFTASSGFQFGAKIVPGINQSSTAGYTALLINPTQTATGSGTKLLIDMQVGGVSLTNFRNDGVWFPVQAPTASAPTYTKGGIYFDTTLNKLRVGGASGWETVTSS
jgi:hypothetical protein